MAEVSVGDVAPDFDIPGDGGKPLKLTDLRGAPVVLYFYPSDDSETCTAEAIAFSRLMPQFKEAGARVIGISPDGTTSHGKFKQKHDLKVELAADEDRRVIENYGLWVHKVLFGHAHMGVERSTFLIDPGGKVAKIWRKVRVKGHAEAVLSEIKKLPKKN